MANTDTLLSKASGALQRFAGLWSRYGGYGVTRFRMLMPGARFDWERDGGDPWMNSVVALGLAWIGDRAPRPRMKVSRIGRGGQLVEQPKHGLVDLWSRPNPYYGRRTLEKAIALSLKVDGNAYIHKVRDRGGRVCQLWWIPHFRILPTWPSDGLEYIDGYLVQVDGRQIRLPVADVLHIRDGIDPRNERLGIAALKASLRELCTDNYAASYSAALLKNSGVPAVAMVPEMGGKSVLAEDEADRMAERFMDMHSGDNVGRPVVFKGNYRIEQVGFTPENLVIDKLPQPAQARLAACLGVAAMSLGLPDPGKTYSNLEEANRTSWGTIVALQELISDAIGDDLLRESLQVDGRVTPPSDPRDFTVEYDYSQIQELQESLDSLHTRTREDWKVDLITKNEARDQLGYEEDPDGDAYFSEATAPPEPEVEPGMDEDGEPIVDEAADEKPAKAKKSWRY